MTKATIAERDNIAVIPTKSKPGRKVGDMGYGNIPGRSQKGLYLSNMAQDMLKQLVIVCGKTESAHGEDAVREYFMRKKAEYEAANISWNRVLEAHKYVVPAWQR